MPAPPPVTSAASAAGAEGAALGRSGFEVHLDVFEGPFDLLLSLIAKRKLDVTLVALSKVTDEFVGYIRSHGDAWDLDTASEFLVVAATLLDLKVARLLPSAEADEEDLALLEARDLLFARLLQYRAYKDVVSVMRVLIDSSALRYPRLVPLEERFVGLLPEVQLGVSPAEFAELAARAMTPRPAPVVDIGHLHAPLVSVREQAAVLAERLRGAGTATFRALVADCPDTMTVVGRFLAVLELYREGAVAFEQVTPLGELHVRWVAGEGWSPELTANIDAEYDETDAEYDDTAVDDSAATPAAPSLTDADV
ncbi:MAG TPA: segregation/condensation protein A [Mycobacteriales bacterium]|nr:segregation/condensation protein A [Mycobacteriales bacterium]